AAFFLIAAKAGIGIWTGSLALLSEAAHSSLDMFASLVTLLAVRASDRPPDQKHHYGHGKIESMSALFESVLLFAVCIWISYEAFRRLLHPEKVAIVNIYSFGVVIMAIGIDLYRYRALMKMAKKHKSQALEADAIHFFSDILSSSLVLLGLIAVLAGYPWADPIAALLVAVWVGILAVRLAKKNIDVLIDRVPDEPYNLIQQTVESTMGVLAIESLRLRGSGNSLFADLRVGLDRTLTFGEAHRVARQLEVNLIEKIPGIDVVVHADPLASPNESLDLGILHFIRDQGLDAHHLILRRNHDRYIAELHLEVDGEQSIGAAHDSVSDLEERLLKAFPGLEAVQVHIEAKNHLRDLEPCRILQPELIARIETICADQLGPAQCHDVTLSGQMGELSATMHCNFSPDLSVDEVHRRTTRLEEEIRRVIPELDWILIHAEPQKAEP
ncbi:MAG: cation diffusion facilitator family transporter, partial [bacterium]|nr:cation diffusion facilitator family transporter [bacterium]